MYCRIYLLPVRVRHCYYATLAWMNMVDEGMGHGETGSRGVIYMYIASIIPRPTNIREERREAVNAGWQSQHNTGGGRPRYGKMTR